MNIQQLTGTLSGLFTQTCKHTNRWGVQQYNCLDAAKLIDASFNLGIVLTSQIVNEFYKYISKDQYYYEKNCLQSVDKEFILVLKKLFALHPPPISLLTKLLEISKYDECYQHIPNGEFLNDIDTIINSRLKYSSLFSNDDGILVTTILDKIQLDQKILKKLIGCRSKVLQLLLASIVDKTTIELTQDMLDESCKILPLSEKVIISLISRGLSLNTDHLEIVCKTGDIKSIDFIIHTAKLNINNKHFNAVILSKEYYVETDMYKIRNMPDIIYKGSSFAIGYSDAYSEQKMELLIKNGYIVTYADLLFSIKHKKEIPGINRFPKIKLDTKALEACWDVDFYPKNYEFDCISKNQIHLQELCKTRKVAEIKKLLNSDSTLVVDRKCMENSCNYASNAGYDILRNKGGVPTIKCIKNISKMVKNNRMLLQVIDDFEQEYNNEIKKYKDRIVELEQKQVETKESQKKNDESSPKKVVLKKTLKNNNKNIIVEDDDLSPKKVVSNTLKNKNIIKDVEEDKTENQVIKNDEILKLNYIVLPIDAEKSSSLQKEYRTKKLPSDKMIKLLEVSSKKKLNYSDVRNCLITKIKDDGWVDKDNKNIIKLPINVKKLLAIKDKSDLISFDDIDKLVCLLY